MGPFLNSLEGNVERDWEQEIHVRAELVAGENLFGPGVLGKIISCIMDGMV